MHTIFIDSTKKFLHHGLLVFVAVELANRSFPLLMEYRMAARVLLCSSALIAHCLCFLFYSEDHPSVPSCRARIICRDLDQVGRAPAQMIHGLHNFMHSLHDDP
jgi:hypothetical protein